MTRHFNKPRRAIREGHGASSQLASPSRRAALGRSIAALAAALGVSLASASQLEKQPMRIAASAAPEAIAEFIRQTGLQVLFDFDAVCNFSTREVSGQLDAEEALQRMFEGRLTAIFSCAVVR
jgi:hypothetical protein